MQPPEHWSQDSGRVGSWSRRAGIGLVPLRGDTGAPAGSLGRATQCLSLAAEEDELLGELPGENRQSAPCGSVC